MSAVGATSAVCASSNGAPPSMPKNLGVMPAAIPRAPALAPVSLPQTPPMRPTDQEDQQAVGKPPKVPKDEDAIPERPTTPPALRHHRLPLRAKRLVEAVFTPTSSARAVLDQLYTSYMFDNRTLDLSAAVPHLVGALKTLKPDDFIGMAIRMPGASDTFEIVQCMGTGGSAAVFQAVTSDGRDVAIKIFNKAQLYATQGDLTRTLIEKELTAMKKITKDGSPYLNKVLASWSDPCFIYVVMPLGHSSLIDLLEKQPRTPLPFVLYAAELVSALSSLHRLNYAHCDIKPGNILVMPSGHLALSDFGTVVQLGDEAAPANFVGTVPYAAPEMAAVGLFGKPHYGQPVDIWSLGVTLLELASGSSIPIYFAGKTTGTRLLKILKTEPTMLPQMQMLRSQDPRVYDLLQAMLQRDPAARPTIEEIKLFPCFNGVDWEDLEGWASKNGMDIWKPPSRKLGPPATAFVLPHTPKVLEEDRVIGLLKQDVVALGTSDMFYFHQEHGAIEVQ